LRELWVTERTPRGGHRSEVFAHAGRRQPLEGAPAGGAYRQHLTAQADLLLEQNRIAGSLLSVRNPTSRVYVFYFDHPPPGRDREFYGAWHSSDLWYTFNSLRNEPGQRQWTPHDFELAEQASSMWANFVKTGDPNGDALPVWPRSTRVNNGTYLSFGEKSTSATSASPYLGTTAERRNAVPRLRDEVLRCN
jgi:para-nitrobenzyl esterase